MKNSGFFEDISNKIKDMAKSSPLEDLGKNVNALLQGAFTKLELVSRDEFDVQADLLRLTRKKLEDIQARIDALESKAAASPELLQKNNK